jgi:UDP:flavonoid glycosyltransferase YjiC (YdhE family)
MFAPTRAFPNVGTPKVPPGPLSYFSHWTANQVFWHIGNMGFRKMRASSPDDVRLKLHWPFDSSRPITTPLLFAHSPTLLPKPAEWEKPHIHVTGFFFLNTAEGYKPPPELADFLAAGEAPVCVTFGSMVNRESERIYEAVRAAIRQSGQRAIILTGWGGEEHVEHDDALFYLKAAPHDWLLPKCKAVIHHGGAGTTAAGLRAGIPNIVIPHAADQPFWALRVTAIGAGPRPISFSRLSSESLLHALAQASSVAMRAHAQEIGRKIRAEDGVGWAVRLIERHAADPLAVTGAGRLAQTSQSQDPIQRNAARAGEEQG